MAENLRIDRTPFKPEDLEYEFERSGLPKSALAGMLSVTKAIVTRLVKGTRLLDGGETITARSFFALVPKGVDRPFWNAVRQLTKTEKLTAVAKALVGYDHLESEFGLQIESAPTELRADTIVHVCRIGRIDLELLVRNLSVVSEKNERRLETFDSSVDELYQLASEGAFLEGGRSSPYPKIHSTRPRTPNSLVGAHASTKPDVEAHAGKNADAVAHRSSPILPGAPVDFSAAGNCTNWVVLDDSLEPRYRKGETILVSPPTEGYRHGDDVVVETTDQSVMIGQHLFDGRDELVIEHPKQGKLSIRRNRLSTVSRIAFVVR